MYSSDKTFAYDYVLREEVVTFAKKTDSTLNIRVDSQRRSLNRILLLFTEPYAAGARYSEKYVNLDIKVSVTMKSSPNNVYNNGFEGHDVWKEISRFFSLEKGTSNMDHTKFYTDNKFELLIDLRSLTDTTMHGSGIRLVNTKDSVCGKFKMPRFHNQRSLTENYGQTVPFCAVLNIRESKQHTF